MLLKDKVVLVTGVGPGMTSKLCRAAALEGAKVVLTARSLDFLESVAAEIRAAGGEAVAQRIDVTKDEDCRRGVEKALEAFGRIDGLVNSAFMYPPPTPLADLDLEVLRGAMEVTVFGTLRMCQAVIPHMRKAGGGSIVNVSTLATRMVQYPITAYSTPKGALNQITRQIAFEEGPNNIRCNTVLPGFMLGASSERYVFADMDAEQRAATLAHLAAPMALRHVPKDDDCAKPVMFMLSDLASEVTGAMLDVNGGEWFPA